MSDQRGDPRTKIAVQVEVTFPDGSVEILTTQDISHSGMFIHKQEHALTVGDKLYVRISGHLGDGDEAPLNRVEIVRVDDVGMGVRFI